MGNSYTTLDSTDLALGLTSLDSPSDVSFLFIQQQARKISCSSSEQMLVPTSEPLPRSLPHPTLTLDLQMLAYALTSS